MRSFPVPCRWISNQQKTSSAPDPPLTLCGPHRRVFTSMEKSAWILKMTPVAVLRLMVPSHAFLIQQTRGRRAGRV
jgi:hypothetical protein